MGAGPTPVSCQGHQGFLPPPPSQGRCQSCPLLHRMARPPPAATTSNPPRRHSLMSEFPSPTRAWMALSCSPPADPTRSVNRKRGSLHGQLRPISAPISPLQRGLFPGHLQTLSLRPVLFSSDLFLCSLSLQEHQLQEPRGLAYLAHAVSPAPGASSINILMNLNEMNKHRYNL